MTTSTSYVTRGRAYQRDMDYVPDRVTAEPGRSRDRRETEPLQVPTWPVEPGRYRLVVTVPGHADEATLIVSPR